MALEQLSATDWTSALHALGKRVTRQRLVVLDAVQAQPHSTAEQIHTAAKAVLPDITVQSVYGVLTDATGWGLVSRLAGVPARYETRVGDNHHHLICVSCGVVRDVDCVVGAAPCLEAHQAAGMQILSADVVFRAICTECQQGAPAQSPTPTSEEPIS